MRYLLKELTSIKEINSIADSWTQLLEIALSKNMFLTPEWHLCWFKAMGSNANPAIVIIEDENGKLKGILPMARISHSFGPLKLRITDFSGSEIASGDHLDLITTKKDFDRVFKLILKWLEKEICNTHIVRFSSLRPGLFSDSIMSKAEQHGWKMRERLNDVAPYLTLPDTYEDFEKMLSSNHRQQIRRYWRKLKKDYKNFKISINNDLFPLEDVLNNLTNLHTKLWNSRGQSGTLSSEIKQKFLIQFCKIGIEKGWLRLHQIYLDSRLIYAIIVFHWKKSTYYYQSGWDTDFMTYRIGKLGISHSIKSAIEEKMEIYDFLRGDEQYKKHFTKSEARLYNYELSNISIGRIFMSMSNFKKCISEYKTKILPGRQN